MHKASTLFALAIFVTVALTGCQSHQAKVDALQKEYDRLGQQFGKDCESEMINVPPKLSPKCSDEKKKLEEAWNRLQAERATK